MSKKKAKAARRVAESVPPSMSSANTAALLNTALQHHQQGQLPQAEALYRRILAAQPGHPEALHLLGVIGYQAGRHEEAVEQIGRAIASRPNVAAYHSNLGMALRALGRLEEAAASYHRALQLNPEYAEAHNNLGVTLRALGRLQEAAASCRRAAAIRPEYAEAWNNLGTAQQDLGNAADAVASYQRAVGIAPGYVQAWSNLGAAHTALGQLAPAVESCRRALDLDPACSEAHHHLGAALHAQGRLQQAEESYRQAVAAQPDFIEAWLNLGNVLDAGGRLSEAEACYRRSAAIRADYPEAPYNLGNVLFRQGRVGEAVSSYRQTLAIRPLSVEAHSNLLMALEYDPECDRETLFQEYCAWDARHARPHAAMFLSHPNDPDPDRPLRVGYVSADFRNHPVALYLEPVLRAHDRAQIEVFCYSNNALEDRVTERLRAQAGHWRSIVGVSDTEAAAQVRADGIDILCDLSGHTGGNRLLLFARKPAPVQVTWMGYPGTTGLRAMDYILVNECVCPAGNERFFAEKVMHLPLGLPAYTRPAGVGDPPPVPMLSRGAATFGCFNNLAKAPPAVLRLWARILRQLPGSRLHLKTAALADEGVRERVLGLFAEEGIPGDRILLSGRSPMADYFAAHGQVDVALDPFPYNGGTTTLDALWMGVPVVALKGDRYAARCGFSHLSAVGLQELVAENADEYVAKAVSLATDGKRLEQYRGTLRARLESAALYDAEHFARKLEAAFREMWRAWCEGQGGGNPPGTPARSV